jgi:hypothetical protein
MTMKSVTIFLLAVFLSVATTMVNVTGNNDEAGTAYAQDEGNGDNNQEGTAEPEGNNNQSGTDEPDGANNQSGTDEADGDNNNLDCDLNPEDCVL